MDSPFCSLSPLFPQYDDALLENTILFNNLPDFQIPQVENILDHISPICSHRVEENLEKEKKLKSIQEENLSAKKTVEKKIMHRDIERQRRQEMTALYSSLRSVLPPQQLKGKRSTSDQLNEAAKYIQLMQKRIAGLTLRRDNLKKSLSKNGKFSEVSPFVVKVHPCGVGAEILITSETSVNIPILRIVRMLLDEGLAVVSYNCVTFDGRLNYMIQAEVGVGRSAVDLNMLQRKISYMIKNWV